MELSLYPVIFTLGNVGKVYMIYSFFRTFYQEQAEQKQKRSMAVLYICSFLFMTLAAFAGNPSPLMSGERIRYYTTDIYASDTATIWMLLAEWICLAGIPFYYETCVRKNLLAGMGLFGMFRISELVAFYIVQGSGLMNVEMTGVFRVFISTLLIYTAGFLTTGIIRMRKGVEKPAFYWAFTLIVPGGLFYLFFCFFVRVFCQVYDKNARWTFFRYLSDIFWANESTIIVLFILCFCVFSLYDHMNQTMVKTLTDTYKKIQLENENQYYENRLKDMERSITVWKKMRHDLKNHFIVLDGMLELGQIKEAKKYLEDMVLHDAGSKGLVESGNVAIDSIIHYKILEAEQCLVTFDLDLQIPEKLDIPPNTMSVVLGNAIDNAIEASKKTEEKKVSIILRYTKGRLLMQISNPYSGELKMTDSGRYLTWKEEKEDHGFGLENIRQTVEKAGGVMNIETKEQRFVLTVLFYL